MQQQHQHYSGRFARRRSRFCRVAFLEVLRMWPFVLVTRTLTPVRRASNASLRCHALLLSLSSLLLLPRVVCGGGHVRGRLRWSRRIRARSARFLPNPVTLSRHTHTHHILPRDVNMPNASLFPASVFFVPCQSTIIMPRRVVQVEAEAQLLLRGAERGLNSHPG